MLGGDGLSSKPVYLISGSDRPKIRIAVERLRNRFEDGRRRAFSRAGEHRRRMRWPPATRSACSAASGRLVIVEGVEDWKAADAKTVAEYLKSPAPETVLALVAAEMKKDSALAKTCAKARRRAHVRRAEKARAAGAGSPSSSSSSARRADRDACRLLVELVGEDLDAARAARSRSSRPGREASR